MKQRGTILPAITARRTPRAEDTQTEELAALIDHQQDLLKIRWWRWRHCFLELKRLQLDQRRGR
jgi:hypothetical protein